MKPRFNHKTPDSIFRRSLGRLLERVLVDGGNRPRPLPPRTVVIPPGARDHAVRFDAAGREEFRRIHGLAGKFVVMYSGNHSPCHPLDTLLAAAEALGQDPRFTFCFIGGGSRFEAVAEFARSRKLDNIYTLPYQPEARLSASLSAADLHTVVMGDAFVGIIHPSKIYNVLALGIPILYVGPPESHVTDLAPAEANGKWFFSARHGEVDHVVDHVLSARASARIGDPDQLEVAARFSHRALLDELSNHVVNQMTTQP
ncbi:MAG: glycosyltransferase family 4 protein [bacterium]|nr:glycosyltransferase family 4 protein [bacterium]